MYLFYTYLFSAMNGEFWFSEYRNTLNEFLKNVLQSFLSPQHIFFHTFITVILVRFVEMWLSGTWVWSRLIRRRTLVFRETFFVDCVQPWFFWRRLSDYSRRRNVEGEVLFRQISILSPIQVDHHIENVVAENGQKLFVVGNIARYLEQLIAGTERPWKCKTIFGWTFSFQINNLNSGRLLL